MFHPNKRQDLSLPKASKSGQAFEFEYLGYRYSIQDERKALEPRLVRVGIAESKINRIKSRLILSARNFFVTGDFALFDARLRYLTGNYSFQKRKALATTGEAVVKSGIYYSYKFCGLYQGGSYSPCSLPELRRLDWFLQNSILSQRHPLGSQVLASLSQVQLDTIRAYSFSQGHLRRFTHRLNSEDVVGIRRIWQNV